MLIHDTSYGSVCGLPSKNDNSRFVVIQQPHLIALDIWYCRHCSPSGLPLDEAAGTTSWTTGLLLLQDERVDHIRN